MSGMVLSDIQKKAVFKACRQEFRSLLSSDVDDYCLRECDRLLALLEELPSARSDVAAYSAKVKRLFAFITDLTNETVVKPMDATNADAGHRLIAAIRRLRSDVERGIIDLDKVEHESRQGCEWRGAGVIVTSGDSHGSASDVVVRSRYAETISWVMWRLNDMAEGLDALNVGLVGIEAKNFLEAHGDSETSLGELVIHLLDTATQVIDP